MRDLSYCYISALRYSSFQYAGFNILLNDGRTDRRNILSIQRNFDRVSEHTFFIESRCVLVYVALSCFSVVIVLLTRQPLEILLAFWREVYLMSAAVTTTGTTVLDKVSYQSS